MTWTVPTPALGDEVLTARVKGIPERAIGLTVDAFLAEQPRLSEFWTPLVAIDAAAMRANIGLMAAWTAAHGLQLMPHGKTTMAPAIWRQQLAAGSAGITLATMGQVRIARSNGITSIMLANAPVDARSLAFLARELEDPLFQFACWADSTATVDALERGLRAANAPRTVDVCVELGAPGGRTGARTIDGAVEVGRRIVASPVLRLAGVAGYEGSLAHDRSEASLDVVRRYLRSQLELHARLGPLYDGGSIFVTAGGSAYFDVVAEVYAERIAAEPDTRWTLRSGSYVVHDDGYYRSVSPLDGASAASTPPAGRFRPAMAGIARVVSKPEPGLALLDAGKRDLPYDEGLPIPRAVAADLGDPWVAMERGRATAMNDQHTFLASEDERIVVGSVVRLGLSHPCTTFDKWQFLPVVADAASDEVVDLVRTFF